MQNKVFATKTITYVALLAALSIVLNLVELFSMPMGGGVTLLSMFFIALAGCWFGAGVGFVAGVVVGLIQLLLGAYVIHPAQFILDYPLAFGVLGLSGIFAKRKFGLQIGYAFGVFLRFVVASLSGYIFFREHTPEGMNPIWYTIAYNGSYLGVEGIITLIVISVPAVSKALDVIGTLAKPSGSRRF